MANTSRFQFIKSQHVPTLTVLQAAIEDFSYDRHAHEEFAFGVTLAGRQDFFSGGQFHKSPPGNVILFNPEEVHDGQPGGEHALDYLMVYAHPEQLKPLFADALGREHATDFRSNQTLIQDVQLRHAILELARLVTSQAGSCIDQEMRFIGLSREPFSSAACRNPTQSQVDLMLCSASPKSIFTPTWKAICRWMIFARQRIYPNTISCACFASITALPPIST